MKSFILIFILIPIGLAAQDEAFIYGRISTKDGNTYEGPIRWGKEEVYWTDLFNASKEDNENLRRLSTAERDKLDEQQAWAGGDGNSFTTFVRSVGLRTERYIFHSDGSYVHQFGCQFRRDPYHAPRRQTLSFHRDAEWRPVYTGRRRL